MKWSTELAQIRNNSVVATPITASVTATKNKCEARRHQSPTNRFGSAIATHPPINIDQIAVAQFIIQQTRTRTEYTVKTEEAIHGRRQLILAACLAYKTCARLNGIIVSNGKRLV